MRHTFIPEIQAAELTGFKPRTLRAKVKGIGRYRDCDKLPICFTTGGKGLRYSKEDIEKHLAKTSSK